MGLGYSSIYLDLIGAGPSKLEDKIVISFFLEQFYPLILEDWLLSGPFEPKGILLHI